MTAQNDDLAVDLSSQGAPGVPGPREEAGLDCRPDVKTLADLMEAVVESYHRFYGKGVKKAAAEARKALQAIKIQVMNMRKQIQSDKMGTKAAETPKTPTE